jgi:hypothetical protein
VDTVGMFRWYVLMCAVNTRQYSSPVDLSYFKTAWKVLTRIYGRDVLAKHNYSKTLDSLGFAGNIVGMLCFGKSPCAFITTYVNSWVQQDFCPIRLVGNLEWWVLSLQDHVPV